MSENVDLEVGIDAKVDGTGDTKTLATAVEAVGSALDDLVKLARGASRSMTQISQEVTGAGQAAEKGAASQREYNSQLNATGDRAKGAVGGVNQLAEAYERAATASNNFAQPVDRQRIQAKVPSGTIDPSIGKLANVDQINATNAALQAKIRLYSQINDEINQEIAAEQKLVDIANKRNAAQVAMARRNNPANQITGNTAIQDQVDAWAGVSRGAADATDKITAANSAFNKGGKASSDFRDSLFTARFALHDISNGLALAGGAMLAFNAATLKTAIDYQAGFANIQRTTGATASELATLRAQFVDLQQTIPVSFEELAGIGTLAGQLGVAEDRVASFTETTAKFVATTDVTADAAATAFGRLDALLPDVQGNYEALGSSILNVGINSVATESEIIATTSQIAAAGAQAGFTADQVIGLAASFASLGVAPEAARGTTIRVFSEIRSAVIEGGEALTTFANLAGESSEQFQADWRNPTKVADTFIKVLSGLQGEGENAETTLRGLGITAVRDINALLKLSQNTEIVAQNFGYAAEGFAEGTQLGDNFAIIAETLSSKLQVLGQSLQALVATLGESGLGPLSTFVDLLNGMLGLLTDVATNPIAQWAAVTVGLFTALAGSAALVAAGVARIGAGAVALRSVRLELAGMQAQALAASGSVNTLQGRLAGAGLAATSFKGALTGIAAGAGIAAGFAIITAAVTIISDEMRSATDNAKALYGSFDDVTAALQKDTEAAANGAKVYGTIQGEITRTRDVTAGWVSTVEDATGGQVTLGENTTNATKTVTDQTLAIGENTAALLANKLANQPDVQNFLTQKSEPLTAGNPLDRVGVIAATVKGDTDGARQIVQDFLDFYANAPTTIREKANQQAAAANEIIDTTEGLLQGAANTAEVTKTVMDSLGISAATTGDEFGGMGEEASTLSQQLSDLGSAVQEAFAGQNAIIAVANDFYQLVQAIAEGTDSFNAFDESGRTNLANLQSSISSTIQAGQVLGIGATESVAALFSALQAQGIDTARLLASLANIKIPGVSVSGVGQYVSGTKQLSDSSSRLASSLSAVGTQAKAAAKTVGGSGGGGGGSVASAAKKAAEEVRTLADYASDLGKVFSRAFDIRFGGSKALDNITEGWMKISDAADAARRKIADANAAMQGLAADKSIQEYFLGIATAYGDELRAAEIRAELADISRKQAAEQQKVADANADVDKSLQGNSKAALQNRSTLIGLVGDYQDYIESLATSGLSQEELRARTAQLRAEFIQQAAQLGYNASEVETYAQSFNDMGKVIDAVPRNITINVTGLDAAGIAIAEFVAKAKAALGDPDSGGGGGGGGGGSLVDAGVGVGEALSDNIFQGLSDNLLASQARYTAQAIAGLVAQRDKYAKEGNAQGAAQAQAQIDKLQADLVNINLEQQARKAKSSFNSGFDSVGNPTIGINQPDWYGAGYDSAAAYQRGMLDQFRVGKSGGYGQGLGVVLTEKGFKGGGYTGNGGASEIAGAVHGQEFVFDAASTKRLGVPYLNSLMNGTTNTQTAVGAAPARGATTMMVELSPTDRALLAAAGNVQIQIGNESIGRASNGATLNATQRGTN